MQSSVIPEYETLANTLLAWCSEITTYFLYHYDTNTKIKLLKRIRFGIPTFQKLINLILLVQVKFPTITMDIAFVNGRKSRIYLAQ